MNDTLFYLANGLVLPVWAMMMVAPGWPVTKRVAGTLVVPALCAVIYLGVLVANIGATEGGFSSLEDVVLIFQNEGVVLVGWVHYLCLDLVVGTLIFHDARKRELPHWLLMPVLALTMIYGPTGFLLYWLIRVTRERSLKLV